LDYGSGTVACTTSQRHHTCLVG